MQYVTSAALADKTQTKKSPLTSFMEVRVIDRDRNRDRDRDREVQ